MGTFCMRFLALGCYITGSYLKEGWKELFGMRVCGLDRARMQPCSNGGKAPAER
jgi:hypothetical protein